MTTYVDITRADQYVFWNRCTKSFARDFIVELTAFKLEKKQSAHGVVMAYDVVSHRMKFVGKFPVLQLYKCIDRESMKALIDTNELIEKPDDRLQYVRTVSDLKLEETIRLQFSDDDSRCAVFSVNVSALLSDGWVPMYDRGYVYWYHHAESHFRATHVPERVLV